MQCEFPCFYSGSEKFCFIGIKKRFNNPMGERLTAGQFKSGQSTQNFNTDSIYLLNLNCSWAAIKIYLLIPVLQSCWCYLIFNIQSVCIVENSSGRDENQIKS